MSRKHQLSIPIMEQVYQVLYEGKSPMQAVSDLESRAQKPEQAG